MLKIKVAKFFLFHIVTIASGLFPSLSHAWSYADFISCDSLNPTPIISLKVSYGKLVHDSATPYQQIQSLTPQNQEKCPLTSGLAIAPIKFEINLRREKTVEKTPNAICVFAQNIEVLLYYEDPAIYISNEYNYKSCHFSQVLRHFQTHQQINKVSFELALPFIYKAIRESFGNLKAYKAHNNEEVGQASQKLLEYYTAQVATIVNKFEKIRQEENKKFDELAKKDFLENVCKEYHQYHKDVPIFKDAVKTPIPF